MTLKDYYEALPRQSSPKSDFIKRVTRECGVEPCTVRNWIKGSFNPGRREQRSVLARITGIPERELFPNCE